jgi:formate dehydrogenase iron-sulfur subunit
MSNGKSMLLDTSRCTPCRGCQVACKQWNGLPGTKTTQRGRYQNPEDLSFETYKVVRFADGRKEDGKPYWYFFSDHCRHCIDSPCLDAIGSHLQVGGVRDEVTGAVLYLPPSAKAPFEAIRAAGPYNIPRQNPKTKGLAKCTLCFDRISNNKGPACVQSRPTGSMVYGDRKEILALVAKRVEELKKTYPKAMALNSDEVRVIYIVTDDPRKYHQHAAV